MRKKFSNRLLSAALSVVMVLSMLPAGFAAEDPGGTGTATTKTYTFDSSVVGATAAGTAQTIPAGTDNYFTMMFGTKTKIDASNKSWDDGYSGTHRFSPGASATATENAVKFTTNAAGATVKIWWVEGGGDTEYKDGDTKTGTYKPGDVRNISVLDASANEVTVNGTTLTSTLAHTAAVPELTKYNGQSYGESATLEDNQVAGRVYANTVQYNEFTLGDAGTYIVGTKSSTNYIYKIEVTDEAPAAQESAQPSTEASADVSAEPSTEASAEPSNEPSTAPSSEPTTEPTQAPAQPDPSKVDVWDFGAEQLDEAKFNNMLDADTINGWYPGTAAGTASVALPNTVAAGDLTFTFSGTSTRLRTSNTALTRYDGTNNRCDIAKGQDIYDADRTSYAGVVCSNGNTITLKLTATAGDKLTYMMGANAATEYPAVFTSAGGVEQTATVPATHAGITFYADQDGDQTVFAGVDGGARPAFGRVYRERAKEVTVSGALTAPAGIPAGYKLILTNDASGIAYEATVSGSSYTATVANYQSGASYTLSLEGADGYVVSTGVALELAAADTAKTNDVAIVAVDLANVSGQITGLETADLANLVVTITKPEGKVYQPKVEITDGTYTASFEKGVTYGVVAANVNDYTLNAATVKYDADATADIAFTAKPVYDITVVANPAEVDLSAATITFVNINEADDAHEEGYTYTFTGTDGIRLRDGQYKITVKGLPAGTTQDLTSDVKVRGAAVTKTVDFIVSNELPTEWNFRGGSPIMGTANGGKKIEGSVETWQHLQVDATATGSKFDASRTDWVQFNTGAVVKVPVEAEDGQKVNVTVVVNGNAPTLTVGEGENAVANANKTDTIETTAQGGYITITATANDYLGSIKVEPVVEDDTIYTAWDFVTDAPARGEAYPAATTAGLTGTSDIKSHGSNYGATAGAGTIVVPVVGECTVKVAVGYTWDVQFESEAAQTQTTDGGNQTLTYAYTGGEGTVTITIGSTTTTYMAGITLDYAPGVLPEVGDLTFKVGADKEYKTINAALAAVKAAKRRADQRAIIEIDPGNYEEQIWMDLPNVTLKNAAATPSIELTNKGVDIADGAVRITHYYGHGYTYYSMTDNHRYSEKVLAVNKENGYPSYINRGNGNQAGSYWNATVVVIADGFAADGIIFENSFNQYVSAKAANDVIVPQTGNAKEDASAPRASLPQGSTKVQEKAYVERAAALAIANGDYSATFNNCKFVGRQDTLDGGTNVKAAFYDCSIYGSTDYIMGPMKAVFAKCDLVFNTSEHKNDVGYITAPQNSSGNGYLFYNCTVTSTQPGVDTASAKLSKPGLFGRPWMANTGEAVFYKTIIEATDPSYFTNDISSTSLIQPAGWLDTLSGQSDKCAEFGTMEWYEGVDNSESRAAWSGGVLAEEKSPVNSTELTPAAWLGDTFAEFWADKDLTIVEHTPEAAPDLPTEPTTTPGGSSGGGHHTNPNLDPDATPAPVVTPTPAPTPTPEPNKVETTTNDAGDKTITVTSPAGEVVAEVKLPATAPALEEEFTDVPGHWAEKEINAIAALGLVNGVDTTAKVYGTETNITRGALATVLYRFSNGKEGLTTNFPDVASGVWYTDGIAWASKVGVVTGYDNGTFRPEQNITRQELAVMLCRYARLIGLDTRTTGSLSAFTDGASVGAWAADSLAWCVEKGILKGRGDGILDPTATATRAECAVMLNRFIDLLK